MKLIEDYSEFAKRSIDWSIRKSDEAAISVSDAIFLIIEDVDRVAQMSDESIAAGKELASQFKEIIGSLKEKIESSERDNTSREGNEIGQLITALSSLKTEYSKLAEFFNPVIEALQFQDRLRQNLENQQKMIGLWIKFREKSDGTDPTQLKEFGNDLLDSTTMIEEREVIRKYIGGLKEDEAQVPAGDLAFF